MPQETLGFIGYGAMASRIGRRLHDHGYRILAFTPTRAPGTAEDGVRYLEDARALAESVETILVSVPNDAALETAMYDAHGGALAGARAGSLLIDLSSVSPAASRRLAAAGEAKGVSVLDAPVSGSTPEAEAGKLVVLAGGAKADFERALPIFSIIGGHAVHAGAAGQGSVLKLVVNGVMGTTMAAIAEGVGYGLAAGLDRDVLFDTLAGSAVVSAHHQRKLRSAQQRDFAPQFPTALMHKDLALLIAEAAASGLPIPANAAATQTLSLGRPEQDKADYSALIGVMEHLAATRR